MAAPFDLDNAVTELRRPFTPAAVKFKPLTKPNGQPPKSSAAFYIDARLVAERLNAVVGAAAWSDEYDLIAEGRETPALYYPIVCRLTVAGVTKSDVGQGANTILDDKAWKSAYSDALKRAAVKFGVGAYLYAIPRLWAPVDVGGDGKAKGFTKEGKAFLVSSYERWLKSPLNTFGDPLDHGDVAEEDEPDTSEQAGAGQTAAEPLATAAEQKKLDRLIVNLGTLDASRDWASIANKYVEREFRHGRDQLTKSELPQVVAALEKYLGTLGVEQAREKAIA